MATTTSKGSKSDVNPSQKLSLRQRLFSSGSRKSAGAAQTPSKQPKQSLSPQTDSAPPAAAESAPNHQEEPSTSTSSTLTAGQQPDTTEAAATSSDKKATETDNLSPDMLIRTKHDDSDREQGSANTTLASKDRRVPFYRRKTGNKSSTSNTPLTSTSDPALTKAAMGNASASSRTSSSTRSKPSFLSRVVQKVVPCVSPDPDLIATPTIERPTPSIPDSRRMSTNKDPSTTGTIEMQQVDQEAVSSPPTPGAVNVSVAAASASSDAGASSPSTSPQPQSEPSDATPAPIDLDVLPLAITPTTAKDSQPPSPTDSEIIVTPPPNTHLLPEEETDGVTSGAVQPPGSTGHSTPGEAPHRHLHGHESSGDESDGTTYSDDELDDRQMRDEHEEEEWLIKNGGSGIPIGVDGLPKPLLPPILPEHAGRKCLVLDLDETLVHSSFKAVQQADFIVPVEIEYHWHHFHVLKRPGVDNFLKKMGEIYEVVVFTASLSKYADPVLDKLDIHKVVAHRLFRESCFSHKGNYVKDLSQLGRPIADTIILDNSPASYIFHPNNAVPVSSWFNDPHDAELTDLIPFLADLTAVPDVRSILDGAR